ncbi:MAG: helix-turn-helix domain-containing protein [Corynebacterium sp.]|uniref:helix-turn-helix domain-containing protein n=1 Tax=Corynebacterium sp. TaxID=1720 RepID=UPI003F8F270B
MSSPPRQYMSVTAAAKYLDCHPRTVRRMCADGRLTLYRLGGFTRVDQHELDQRMAGD